MGSEVALFASAAAAAAGPSSLADVNALITALGGNAGVLGFYDCRLNVTAPATNVASWADCRTSSPGPLLSTFATGTKPTQASAVSPVVFANGGATISIANTFYNSNFPATVVFIASLAAGTGDVGGVSGNQTDLLIKADTGPLWAINVGTTDAAADSIVAADTTMRTLIAKTTGVLGSIVVPNKAAVTVACTSTVNTSSDLTLGAGAPGAAVAIGLTLAAVLVLNFATSGANDTAIAAWAVTNHVAVNA